MDFPWGWSIFVYLVMGAIIAAVCYSLANKKEIENASTYAVLGFFFGLIVLIYVAGLPDNGLRNLVVDLKNELFSTQNELNNLTKDRTDQKPAPPSVLMTQVIDVPVFSSAPLNASIHAAEDTTSKTIFSKIEMEHPTQDVIVCPACGTKQRDNRYNCYHCGVKFID